MMSEGVQVAIITALVTAIPFYVKTWLERVDRHEAKDVVKHAAQIAAEAAASVAKAREFNESVKLVIKANAEEQRVEMAKQSEVINRTETLVNSKSTMGLRHILQLTTVIASLMPENEQAQSAMRMAADNLAADIASQEAAALTSKIAEDASVKKAALNEDIARAALDRGDKPTEL